MTTNPLLTFITKHGSYCSSCFHCFSRHILYFDPVISFCYSMYILWRVICRPSLRNSYNGKTYSRDNNTWKLLSSHNEKSNTNRPLRRNIRGNELLRQREQYISAVTNIEHQGQGHTEETAYRNFRELLSAWVEHVFLNEAAQIEETALPSPQCTLLHSIICVELRLITIQWNCGCQFPRCVLAHRIPCISVADSWTRLLGYAPRRRHLNI
jgi:hypothetical protein